MLVKLTNQALDYSWGSKSLISDYFGVPATGQPMAEIWFGTHDGSPTKVEANEGSLYELIGKRLPFLLKILAAEAPLSIQAHPNPEQAKLGFALEEQAGIPLTAGHRNYKDDRAKPEMIVALSPSFEALVGFSDPRIITEKIEELIDLGPSQHTEEVLNRWLQWLSEEQGIRRVFLDSMRSPEISEAFIAEFVDLATQSPNLVDLVSHLANHHGHDRGIASALVLNHQIISRGEAIFVPAGMPHAYLSGLGVEVMLASDNVLRGGLTPKHIDVDELERVLVFEDTSVQLCQTRELAKGLEQFAIPTAEFTFYRAVVSSTNLLIDLNLPGDAIVLCVGGSIAISTSQAEREVINLGEAVYLSADAKTFSLTGSGEAYLAISSN
ncbi:MAG: mannose-6-phosphate isomerase, class I [Micrococcales bacterium]|nr:mannose-6-phosphate isomerase, class I [Micrococcales bacterium]NBR54683.1 mannose-6-phosphate isomerase, class I [Micrococcales bacterium]NBR60754.1 mannose-6-phosphate isomerase, class I [Actinomycetota bacterium]NBT46694.1 mannose-6-phosphate isomerase, class I [Actinomycetota bacterium]